MATVDSCDASRVGSMLSKLYAPAPKRGRGGWRQVAAASAADDGQPRARPPCHLAVGHLLEWAGDIESAAQVQRHVANAKLDGFTDPLASPSCCPSSRFATELPSWPHGFAARDGLLRRDSIIDAQFLDSCRLALGMGQYDDCMQLARLSLDILR